MAYNPKGGNAVVACPECGGKIAQSKLRIHIVECKKMKTKKVQPKGPGGTPKPDRKKKEKTSWPEPEKVEAINVITSVERLAGWSSEDLKRHIIEEITRIVSALGGSNGPRFNVEAAQNTIVEMRDDGTWGDLIAKPVAK